MKNNNTIKIYKHVFTNINDQTMDVKNVDQL